MGKQNLNNERYFASQTQEDHVFIADKTCRPSLPLYHSSCIDEQMPVLPGRKLLAIRSTMGSAEQLCGWETSCNSPTRITLP